MPEITKGIKGGKKLIDDLCYTYNIQKLNSDKTKIYWRCDVSLCKAKVHSLAVFPAEIVHTKGEHNHTASSDRVAALKAKVAMKERALDSQDAPRVLISSTVANLGEASIGQLPKPC